MARIKPLTRQSGRNRVLQNGSTCDGSIYFYNGTSLKENPAVAIWTFTGTTDANSRVTCNLTLDGTPTGTAIFAAIYGISAMCVENAVFAKPDDVNYACIETISVNFKQITIRIANQKKAFPGIGIEVRVTVNGQKL